MPHVVSIIWTAGAQRDVHRVHDFFAAKNPEAAARAARTIRQGVNLLASHANIGRPVEELPLGFRELVIEFGQSAYVVMYHTDGYRVIVLAVRHGKEAGY